jgi:hypothetical protein
MPALGVGEESGLVRRADSLLAPVIRDLGIRNGVRLAGIRKAWSSVFTGPLPLHTYPLVLSGNELLIAVDSPVWLQELQFHREDILRRLSPYEVKAVRFRIGRVSTYAEPPVRSRKTGARSLTDKERSFIQEEASKVSDEDLKEQLKTTIEKSITSGKTKIR